MAWNTREQSAPAADGMSAKYETRDLSVRGLAWFLAGFIVAALVIHLVVAIMFRGMIRLRRQNFPAESPEVHLGQVVGARLQVSPAQEMEQFRAREESVLNSYDWIDRPHGIVRIPITQAMELVLREGLPVRPTIPTQNKAKEGK
jgi:hypothetical protein